MDLKHLLLASFLLLFVAFQSASAAAPKPTLPRLLYDRVLPDDLEALKALGLECRPGRTIIQVKEKTNDQEGDSADEDIRRTHMRTNPSPDETCVVCICSASGRDEQCSKRPAVNVNECLYRAKISEHRTGNNPFDHQRSLYQMIRRDLIWQDTALPGAICPRGQTYYTNDENAMNTELYNGLHLPPDTIDRLDFCNLTICFFCVCSVDGFDANCMPRPVWFCDYYRKRKDPEFIKKVYRHLFGQDRAAYFWTLSARMRRSMDDGIYALLEAGGDALCCDHPAGHRRNIHNSVRARIRQLRRRIPKENLLNGKPGGDYDDFVVNNDKSNTKNDAYPECVPFVSQYTDCNDVNRCLGCKRCSCSSQGRWTCNTVKECSGERPFKVIEDTSLQNTLSELQKYLQRTPETEYKEPNSLAREPLGQKRDSLIDMGNMHSEQDLLFRKKRAIANVTNKNGSIVFHHALDELNEDTLKNSSHSGTIEVQKVKPVKFPDTRRMGTYLENNSNLPALDTLHIEFNHPPAYAHHVTDNKLDSTHGVEHHDSLSVDKVQSLISNKTLAVKDKDLSKLIVNELKKGQEHIGDKNAPIMSNITFTPENDTLAAVAFIAGNLLNKLWSIEKYENDESMEMEVLKHEKISELLDLFKEPMTIKQEGFLKNALEKLSEAVDKNKNVENVSLCKNIEEIKKQIHSHNHTNDETSDKPHDCDKHKVKDTLRTKELHTASLDMAGKIKHVLDLIQKFEHVQNNLENLKLGKPLNFGEPTNKPEQTNSLNQYSEILQKLTKILIPDKNRSKKRLAKKLKHQHLFSNDEDFVTKIQRLYDIDLGNVSLSPKDRLLMDYLLNVEKTPDCILGTKTRNTAPANKIEGEILFNLSEFFKIRSFVDLMKLIEPHKTTATPGEITTKAAITVTKVPSARRNNKSDLEPATQSVSLANTKEKLKSHLKSIIEDLTELQNVKGGSTQNLTITDLLPCLRNLLNGGKMNDKELAKHAFGQIQEMFTNLHNEQAVTLPTRRTLDSLERPKSAVVWERIVQSFERIPTRRLLENPKILTLENLKQLMKLSLEKNNLKTYENVEDYTDVLPADKLVFLKSLRKDSNQIQDVLESIETFLDNTPSINRYDAAELEKYMKQVVHVLHIAQNLFSVLKVNKRIQPQAVLKSPRPQLTVHETSKIHSLVKQNKLTRDQIMNQLIKNRIELFITMKEAGGRILDDDTSYQIALRAMECLKHGDYGLAKELYKTLIAHKVKKGHAANAEPVTPHSRFSVVKPRPVEAPPVARFEEPEQPSQGQLLQQLLNMNNLKLR